MDADEPTLYCADEQHDVAVDLARYARLARHVLDTERVPPDVEVALLFVDEATITEYNERFLDSEGPTDVLAFPIDDDVVPGGRHPDHGGSGPGSGDEPPAPPSILGDVIVCPAYAQRSAAERSIALDDELSLLVVHGLLHLLGHDHAEPAETERMQARERALLASFDRPEADA